VVVLIRPPIMTLRGDTQCATVPVSREAVVRPVSPMDRIVSRRNRSRAEGRQLRLRDCATDWRRAPGARCALDIEEGWENGPRYSRRDPQQPKLGGVFSVFISIIDRETSILTGND
jgi:hypothetical protein